MDANAFFQQLEDRRVFNTSIVVVGNFGGGGGGDDLLGTGGFGSGLGGIFVFDDSSRDDEHGSSGLGGGNPGAVTPVSAVPASTGPRFNLRGSYVGQVNVTGVGSTRFTLNVTKQRGSTLTATLRLPRLEESVSGKAQVSFQANRRFTARFDTGEEIVTLSGRRNADGTISGGMAAQFEDQNVSGVFSVRRRAGGSGAVSPFA